jgi:hypothetical protein
MLGQWRIVLRQAEEAVRGGRFDEALALANRPDVSDHQQAVQLRVRLVMDLIARALRRAEVDDLVGAIDDLDQAERFGAPPDSLAAARLNLADRVADEVRARLDAGDPDHVLDRIDELSRRKICGPALRRCREIAEAWRGAVAEARRGEFGRAYEQLDRAERLSEGNGTMGGIHTALAATRRDIDDRQQRSVPQIESLYKALAEAQWPRVLSTAEAVLTSVPEHPAARQARMKAWQQIAAIGPSTSANWQQSGPTRVPRTRSLPDPTTRPDATGLESAEPEFLARFANTQREPAHTPVRDDSSAEIDRFLLWADAVGGFLVCPGHRVILGRAGSDIDADVPLMGDIARRHATLIRGGDGYVLQAHHASFINGKPVNSEVVLRDGDVIRLGSTVELEFRQPSPISVTARLDILSRHRLPLAVDGVLLMADTCIIGGSQQAHIPAPSIKEPVVLYRQAGTIWCRAHGAFEVDGLTRVSRAPLTLHSSVLGNGFSFGLEPLGSRST